MTKFIDFRNSIVLAMAGKSPWGSGGNNDGGDGGDDGPSGGGDNGDDKGGGPRNPWLPGGGSGKRRSANIEDIFKNRGPEGPRRGGGGPRGPNFRMPQRSGGKSWLPLILGGAAVLWLGLSSVHFVQPRQQGVVTWLGGKYAATLNPGTNWTLPWPVQQVTVESEAAITSPIAGTTRDVIERSVAISGVPFTFVDTAGLHDGGDDAIEAIGIDRARSQLKSADLVLWLGPDHEEPNGAWGIEAQVDNPTHLVKSAPMFRVSALTGEGVGELKSGLLELARNTLPKPGEAALNARQHNLLQDSHGALLEAHDSRDPLLIAESLRRARLAFDRLIGRATTEDMLDALFGRFCIGK